MSVSTYNAEISIHPMQKCINKESYENSETVS